MRRNIGYALHFAQRGETHPAVKPLQGFGGARVLEVLEDHDGDIYRTVYTARFVEGVEVLHACKKKSQAGIKTPKRDLERIRQRLTRAEDDYRSWQQAQRG